MLLLIPARQRIHWDEEDERKVADLCVFGKLWMCVCGKLTHVYCMLVKVCNVCVCVWCMCVCVSVRVCIVRCRETGVQRIR